MKQARFVVWVAVSSEEQAERYSPEQQLSLARQHVNKWGGTVVAELSVSESRSIVLFEDACERIPAYAQLRDMIRARSFDVLICYDTTRLGRKDSLILAVIGLCDEAGILVYEIDNPPHSLDNARTYDRKLLDALKAVGSQREVDKLKERLAYGRIGKVKAGGLPGREPPYGYVFRYDADGTRHIDMVPHEAAIIREIYARYLAGSGMQNIATDLQARGVPSPGVGRWQKSGVWKIIERAWLYAGVSRLAPKGKLLAEGRGKWEPIIDASTAQRVLDEHAERKSNRRKANARARLTGVVWCEVCQSPMRQICNEDGTIMDDYDFRAGRHPRKRRALFYCTNNHPGGSVGTDKVIDALRKALDVLVASDLSAIPDDGDAQTERLRAQLAQHQANMTRHAEALRRADTAYTNGLMDDARYNEQVKRVQAAQAAEQLEIDKLTALLSETATYGTRAERLAEIVASGYAMLTTEDTAAANVWFRRYVRVMVRGNRVAEVIWL